MPRPIPSSLAESMPGSQGSPFESGDVMRVHGGIGLPGGQDTDRMGADANANAAEFDGSPWQATLLEAHEVARKVTALAMPELAEFSQAGIDFAALQTGYEAYATIDLKPELVLFPANLPLENWKQIYSELRRRQDIEHPDSDYKLLEQSDGDGLYVWDAVAKVWPDLNQLAVTSHAGETVNGPGNVIWKAIVVPTASREEGGLAVNTSFDLTKNSEAFHTQVRAVGTTALTAANAHMPIGAYLTLQGAHILKDTPLLDKDTWTWNAGTFKNAQKKLRAPAANWDSGGGRVFVGHGDVGDSGDDIGARLPVWG